MSDYDDTYFELVEGAEDADVSLEDYVKNAGAELAQQYCEEIADSIGSAWPELERARQFDELLIDAGSAVVEADDDEEPYEVLERKAVELLAEGVVSNFTQGIELASKRLPRVADAHVKAMRGQ